MIRQPDHVASSGVERDHHLSFPAQPIDFKKDLAPRQVGETVRQGIQVAPMHTMYLAENAISDRYMRSHDQILPPDVRTFTANLDMTPSAGVVAGRKNGFPPVRKEFGTSKERRVGTGIDAKKGRKTRRLTITMGTLVPKDPYPGGDAL